MVIQYPLNGHSMGWGGGNLVIVWGGNLVIGVGEIWSSWWWKSGHRIERNLLSLIFYLNKE